MDPATVSNITRQWACLFFFFSLFYKIYFLDSDPVSAEYVNLIPSDQPKDAYQKVLDISKKKIAFDLRSNDTEVRRIAEKILPVVTRKVNLLKNIIIKK